MLGDSTAASAPLPRLVQAVLRVATTGAIAVNVAGLAEGVTQTMFTTNVCCSYRRRNHDGKKEKGYFLCHAKDGKVERKFIQVNAFVKLKGPIPYP